MKRTRIVCTIGPSSASAGTIEALANAGMDVARLNFSHGTHEDHMEAVNTIRWVSRRIGRPIAIIQDLQGPKIRAGRFGGDGVVLEPNADVVITTEDVLGDSSRFSCTIPELPEMLEPGDSILMADGMIKLAVISIQGGEISCRVIRGGRISDGKGINIPARRRGTTGLTEKDLRDLQLGIELEFDYIAISFVSDADDVMAVREQLKGSGSRAGVIAKIEGPMAIRNLKSIIEASDAIMIARGDLGVEIPLEELPLMQKRIIDTCRLHSTPVITATQMLRTMVTSTMPSRAEVLDIANAVLDGTDALMLSEETAIGMYPVESVEMMSRIAERTEADRRLRAVSQASDKEHWTVTNAVGRAACQLGENLGAKAILAFTMSGSTARLISKYRHPTQVIAVTTDPRVQRAMCLYWGVRSLLIDTVDTTEGMIARMDHLLIEHDMAEQGDLIIITAGVPLAVTGRTNMIKVHTVGSGHWERY